MHYACRAFYWISWLLYDLCTIFIIFFLFIIYFCVVRRGWMYGGVIVNNMSLIANKFNILTINIHIFAITKQNIFPLFSFDLKIISTFQCLKPMFAKAFNKWIMRLFLLLNLSPLITFKLISCTFILHSLASKYTQGIGQS